MIIFINLLGLHEKFKFNDFENMKFRQIFLLSLLHGGC